MRVGWNLLLNPVIQFFDGDVQKGFLWFMTPNPLLGGYSPTQMIQVGREEKLQKFILNCLNENKKDESCAKNVKKLKTKKEKNK